jgi:1,4-alpha-glucan branching enzyme
VWAADVGYPGDEWYLEFHKKQEPGRLRYWRVSFPKDDMDAKRVYDPDAAQERIAEHARHFVADMRRLLTEYRQAHGEAAVVTAMYDTELFGHWWHEGTRWLKAVLKAMAADPAFHRTTCRGCLDALPDGADARGGPIVSLPEGSWGEGGFHWIWLNPETQWMWERIYAAEREMAALARAHGDDPAAARPLRQAARELLLLESSDWPFVTSTGGAPDYAAARVRSHAVNFEEIAKLVRAVAAGEAVGDSPWKTLAEVEARDNPFPDIDPAWWSG